MSEENVEVLRRFIDAPSCRDLRVALSCCDPDIELDSEGDSTTIDRD
jgi:hypothetical protein